MTSGLRIAPAGVDRFDDVVTMLNPRGRPDACWCLHWRQPRGLPVGGRRDHLKDLSGRTPAPGLLAYLPDTQGREGQEGSGDTVVGWVGLAPVSAASSLQRSRVLPRVEEAEWATTWAVMCFVVRPGYRRQGVARALLAAAVDYARDQGAHAVQGFPIEPEPGRRVPVGAAFVGTVGLFESVGFDRVGGTAATSGRLPRWVLRRDLAPTGG
ncbi:GNAT family N-acetyltransferase [Isoptericola sp. NPDC019693]|uniref:GNAT family N-acetyltransferase n=1 Tax=Isoptericola sp. NPDC019693 TaxID=3364009 RepID=UPI0037B701F9